MPTSVPFIVSSNSTGSRAALSLSPTLQPIASDTSSPTLPSPTLSPTFNPTSTQPPALRRKEIFTGKPSIRSRKESFPTLLPSYIPTISPTSQPTVSEGVVCVIASIHTRLAFTVNDTDGYYAIAGAIASSLNVPVESIVVGEIEDLCPNQPLISRHLTDKFTDKVKDIQGELHSNSTTSRPSIMPYTESHSDSYTESHSDSYTDLSHPDHHLLSSLPAFSTIRNINDKKINYEEMKKVKILESGPGTELSFSIMRQLSK